MLFVFLIGLTALGGVFSQDPVPTMYRLPNTVAPRFYTIQLDPDMETGLIKGSARIEVITTSNESLPLNSITLHRGKNMTVNETTAIIQSMDGKILTIGKFDFDQHNTLLVLTLPDGQTLDYNHIYVISLHFETYLNTEPKGLFIGSYNSTSKYIASNFRPTYARDVFPCFDEPQFKVPISLQVWRPASHYAVSTASLSHSSDVSPDNKVLDSFDNTDPISVHSLGLFIGQQPPVEDMGMDVVLPLLTPTPSNIPYLSALISGIMAQFGPLPTTEFYLIVLPDMTLTSFSSYGFLFTSPEVYLGEVGSPLQWTFQQMRLTEEFMRQYVEYPKTPQWWSDVWLSESVGAYLSISHQQNVPWLQDWLNIVLRTKVLGSYTSETGPVITTADLTKWDIENIISDQTVKFKGLSTLLMWNATMPQGLVEKTLSDFIRLPQSVVSTSDLVDIMVSNIANASATYNVTPAVPLLANWLTQPGSPLVWFSIDANSTFTLVQGTPCLEGSPAQALRPVSIAVADGANPDWTYTLQGRWLLNNLSTFEFSNISKSSVINIETAPYRVNYPSSQWDTLTQDVAVGWAPVAVASALQDDAVALSLGGCLNFSTALSLLNNSHHSGLDWYPVVRAAEVFTANIGNDMSGFTAFGLYFASLFSADMLSQLDLRNSTNNTDLIVARELLTPWLCRFNIGSCREAVVQLGAPLWQGNASGIAGSDVDNVACYGARYTPGALEALMSAYQTAESAEMRRLITIALSCLTEQDSVTKLLNFIDQSTFDQMDAQQIMIGLASSVENSQIVLSFIISQSTDLQEKFGVSTLSSVIKNLAKNRIDSTQLSSLLNNTQLDSYVVQSASEAIAASDFMASWYSTYSSQLYRYLPAPPTTTTSSTTTTPTTTTTTTTTPAPAHSTTPAPGSGSALSSCTLLSFALSALLISLHFTSY